MANVSYTSRRQVFSISVRNVSHPELCNNINAPTCIVTKTKRICFVTKFGVTHVILSRGPC
ncbi:MAG: hypothetical protein EPGJADBJ_00974 [Saprospiraceae bacterium]|nr:hypothetical protein [Saprospiraceae bacterium]